MLDHYKLYVLIFRRLFKCSPIIGDACAAEGGQSRGIEYMGCIPRGMDKEDQPMYRARFGDAAFAVGDATTDAGIRTMGECHGYVGSPPCQGSSTMPHASGGLTESKNIP